MPWPIRADTLPFVNTALNALLGLALSIGAPAQVPEPTVATHYFYWYRWPTEHFNQPGAPGREGHAHHFVDPERVSYLDPDWHEAEFRTMRSCGIDVALPVYWGAPGAYERPGLSFSRQGLAPMVEALDRLAAQGEGIGLGLFYDTSTLANRVRGVQPNDGQADLTEPAGRELFCHTVVEYFEAIPKRHWGRHRGRPLVVLYVSGFAAKWNVELGGALRRAFEKRFPDEEPFLVADASWGDVGQTRTTQWGAALHGPRVHGSVVQIGPGYDDSPVPGRHTPVRDREGGAFYEWSWRRAVAAKPELVLIETWNEMHEGTEICATRETGTQYVDLTRVWIDRLRRGDLGPEIRLAHPNPRPRPDLSFGESAKRAPAVGARYAENTTYRRGLRERSWADGPIRAAGDALVSPASDGVRYVYLQVSDHWRFDTPTSCVVRVEHDGESALGLHYDSTDAELAMRGSYKAAEGTSAAESGRRIDLFALPDARFANRQNGGSDLRLVVRGPDLRIRSVWIEPAAEFPAEAARIVLVVPGEADESTAQRRFEMPLTSALMRRRLGRVTGRGRLVGSTDPSMTIDIEATNARRALPVLLSTLRRMQIAEGALLRCGDAVRFVRSPAIGDGPMREGARDGAWTFVFEDGTVASKGEYRADDRIGTWEVFDRSGKLVETLHYENGTRNGECTSHHPDGAVKVRAQYENGQLHGEMEERDARGRVVARGTMQRGVRHGTWQFFQAEKLQAEGEFRAGRQTGPWKLFDRGALRMEGAMVDGIKDGEWTVYSAAGQVEARGLLRGEVKSGEWTFFYPDSKVQARGGWKDGRMHGAWTKFFPNGKVDSEETWASGKKDGDFTWYYPSGELQQRATFRADVLEGPAARWHANGQKEFEGSYVAGKREGAWSFWDASGALDELRSGNYVAGMLKRR